MSNDGSSTSPRHWHGTVGDRYEHHNVWVRGGPSSAYKATRPSTTTSTTDAFASTDRRVCLTASYWPPSQHLYSSNASDSSTNAGAHSPPSVGERRRSSLFENLTNQKRNSGDDTFAARRQSWNEQAQPGGFFSKWWDGYTRGNYTNK
ncbi:hypothetical protein BJX63DRAFT_436425 [Aspergillus granulosus]|uniref:Uncharacterized protein n=1 Tax=Aspergillus granulosus TaxID=176169 RepID=A0ABR4GY36_9EURO